MAYYFMYNDNVISDSFLVTDIKRSLLPSKDIQTLEIMSRDGKWVCRGDSGNVVDVICGKEFIDYSEGKARYNSTNFTRYGYFLLCVIVYKSKNQCTAL